MGKCCISVNVYLFGVKCGVSKTRHLIWGTWYSVTNAKNQCLYQNAFIGEVASISCNFDNVKITIV